MDQDLWLKAMHFHGSVLLQTILNKVEDLDLKEIESEKLNMCLFIKNKLSMLLKPCDYSSDDLPEFSTPTVPIELFQSSSPVDRRDLFFKSLDRGNILILRVINDTLTDNFKLLVLCRQDNCMKLDDLSLDMYLPKLKAELDIAGGNLKSNDLIRAAVCSCSIDERKLYVTLDSNILEDETESVKLGKISELDLPFYLRDVDVGSSYVEYLHHSPEFLNPALSDDIYSYLDVDQNYLYSFHECLDGLKYPSVVCASELKKNQMLNISNARLSRAMAYYDAGNFTDAFIYLNRALSIYPKNTDALVSRGVLHANTNNLRKAFVDVEEALKIDPNHKGARKQMSVLLVSVARMHIESKDITKAQESLDAALNLDPENEDAVIANEKIKGKTSSLGKKSVRIGSNSSDRSDSSSSRKDDFDRQGSFLEASTRAFLASLQKRHIHDKSKKSRHHHHTHHKSRSKSPKKKSDPPDALT